MDKRVSILGYLSQVFMIYGITVGLLNLFCLLFGESAKGFSSIFSLGSDGLSVTTMLQFLLAIALIVTLRFVFMTDLLIRKMPLAVRVIAMFAGALTIILAFIFVCGWFPADEPMAWLMFILCFAVSCTVSTFISILAEKQENKKLAEALQRYKGEQ